YHYNKNDVRFCLQSPVLSYVTNLIDINVNAGILNNFEPCGHDVSYKVGIGRIEYSECFDPHGEYIHERLIYHNKNGIPCGNYYPLSTYNIKKQLFNIYPNPTHEVLHIPEAKNQPFIISDITGKILLIGK